MLTPKRVWRSLVGITAVFSLVLVVSAGTEAEAVSSSSIEYYFDATGDAYPIDIKTISFGGPDAEGNLIIYCELPAPLDIYSVFPDPAYNWINIFLDTDRSTMTGCVWLFAPTIGADYAVTISRTSGGGTQMAVDAFRTPSKNSAVRISARGVMGSETGNFLIWVPLAELGSPCAFNFVVQARGDVSDYLPDSGHRTYTVASATTTTTTQPTTTTTTQPPTTTTTKPHVPHFSDVPSYHPYSVQIADLASRQIVNGFPNGTFQPDAWVARQQFAKMIVKTLGYPVSEADICPFWDVGKNLDPHDSLYPDNYVAVCAAHGITMGIAPGQFAPYDNMTRAQLITMVARAANLSEPPAGYSAPFGQFDATHYPFARRAAYAGLLDGLQGMGSGYPFFDPATRGEVCVLLYNLLHR